MYSIKTYLFHIQFLLLVCLFYGCARPVTPNGGPKDVRPPGIDSTRTTKNMQTNFQKQAIKLIFDEWVVLKDANTQVLVSPPVEKKPSIKLKGKTVTFEFDESTALRNNTTYTINFGSAIQDLTEGNSAKDMRFVFSTGPVLDSLSLGGQIVDAFTGAGVKEVTVLLYDATQPDSALQTGLPYYFTKTDESGQFTLENLAAGQYKVIAIEDIFPIMKWNGAGERIAFMDSLVSLPDTTGQKISMRLSEEEIDLKKTGEGSPNFGLVWLAYSGRPDSLLPIKKIQDAEFEPFISGDTVYVWYRNAPDSTWYFGLGKDTIKVRPSASTEYFDENPLEFAKPIAVANAKASKKGRLPKKTTLSAAPIVTINQLQMERGFIDFGRPLESIDTSLMDLVLDSLSIDLPPIVRDSADVRRLRVDLDWKGDKTYLLQFFPGAITDWYGQSNRDTLTVRFSVLDVKKLSTLEVTFANLESGTQYWIELLNDGGAIQKSLALVATSDTALVVFPALPVVNYGLRVIEDSNANQRWDGSVYAEKRQAERVFVDKVDSLKPDWEVKKRMTLGAFNKDKLKDTKSFEGQNSSFKKN